jgi:7-carboxy-7-deazaguanine synthase
MKSSEFPVEISETFFSIQGEGKFSGVPCFFIRTARCDLRCRYCDTTYAYESGILQSIDEILKLIPRDVNLVEITGGEPLLQKDSVLHLMEALHEIKKTILLETGGHHSLKDIPSYVHIIMDIKLPSSGEHDNDFLSNTRYLKDSDEIKFVISDMNDLLVAGDLIRKNHLEKVCHLVFSPVWNHMDLKTIADFILKEKLAVRLQIQLHKLIWGDKKGV